MKKSVLFSVVASINFLLVLLCFETRASHVSGGNFEWQCLGPDSFLIRLRLFRDCGGVPLTSIPHIQFTSPCGNFTQQFQRVGVVAEVSQLCPSQLPNSSCGNGSLPGMEEHIFEATVVFPQPCSLWTMHVNICCRNTQRLGNTAGGQFQLQAQINTVGSAGNCPNNSPIFGATPIPYVCANQQVSYSPNVYDPDADSLSYAVVQPQPASTSYSSGTTTAPFGFGIPYSFNPVNGQVTFTPDNAMVANGPAHTLVIQVCKYRGNLLLGCVERDFQFVVQYCNNFQPTLRDSGFTNLTGHNNLVDSLHIAVCEGNRLQFDLIFTDSLHPSQLYGDSITISTNISNVFPGANIHITNGNPAVVSFDWVAVPGGASTRSFTVSLEDDACPIPGIGAYNFTISRLTGTFAHAKYICNGLPDSVLLEPVGGDTFYWSHISGTPIIFGQNFTDTAGLNGDLIWVKPDTTTQYLVQSDLITACNNFDTVTVHVNNFNLKTSDTTLCTGDSLPVELEAAFYDSTMSNHVTWTPASTLDNPNTLFPNIYIDPHHGSQYYTVAFNDGNCSFGGSFWIHHYPIYIDSIDWHKPGCGDSNATLTAHFTAPPNSSVLSLDSSLGYSDTNHFTGLPVDYYTIYLKDTINNCVITAQDTIHDLNAPVIYEDSAKVTHASCLGQTNGTIEVMASGGMPPLMYSIDNGLNYTYSNIFTNLPTANYTVRVLDNDSCFALPGTVKVFGDTVVTIDSLSIRDLTCHNDNSGFIKIFAEGGNAYKQFSVDSGQTWHNTGNILNLQAGEYTVLGRDSTLCYSLPSVLSLSEPDRLTASVNLQNDSCHGACGGKAHLTMSGGVPNYTYHWNGFGSNNSQSWNLCAGTYNVQVTDDSLCIFDTVFNILEPDPLQIDSVADSSPTCWYSADGSIEVIASGGTNPIKYSIDGGSNFSFGKKFTALPGDLYNLLVIDSAARCSTEVLTYSLSRPEKIELNTSFNTKKICVSNCEDLTTAASGGFAPYKYHWSHSSDSGSTSTVCPEADEVYAVFAEDDKGCISEKQLFEISLYDSLKVFTENKIEVCPGSSTFLSAYAEGGKGSGYVYSWSPGIGLSAGYGQSVETTPPNTITYTVQVTDQCGSLPATDTVLIEVIEVPDALFEVLDTNIACSPHNCSLINLTPGTIDAVWTINNETVYRGPRIELQHLSEGEYDVQLEALTHNNCTAKIVKKRHIHVLAPPLARFSFRNNEINENDNAVFVVNESSDNATSFEWFVNGEQFSHKKSPVFNFTGKPDSYNIKLIAENQYGCESEYNKELIVDPEFNLFIPNAFTPNADGLNDVFAPIVRGADPDAFEIQIYNRWGQLIFESRTLSTPWDGRINNNIAPMGSYVWKIQLTRPVNGLESYEKTGSVSLIK